MDVIEWLDEAMSPAHEWEPGLNRLRYAMQLLYDVADALTADTPLNRRDLIVVGLNRTEVVNYRLEDAGALTADFLVPEIPPNLASAVLSNVACWAASIALESSVQPCLAECQGLDAKHWLGVNDPGVLQCGDLVVCALGAAASAEAYIVAAQWVAWFELYWFDD